MLGRFAVALPATASHGTSSLDMRYTFLSLYSTNLLWLWQMPYATARIASHLSICPCTYSDTFVVMRLFQLLIVPCLSAHDPLRMSIVLVIIATRLLRWWSSVIDNMGKLASSSVHTWYVCLTGVGGDSQLHFQLLPVVLPALTWDIHSCPLTAPTVVITIDA